MPDINQRPSSRKKINLPKPSELIGSFRATDQQKTILKSSAADFSSTGFTTEKPSTPSQKIANTTSYGTNKPSIGSGKPGLAKRGLSKKKS